MKRQATLDDLDHVEGRAEIVRGKVVLMPGVGFPHARAEMLIIECLREYERRTQLGFAMNSSTFYAVTLPNRLSFCPDGAFYTGRPWGDKRMEGAPLFAIEVRSPGDYGLRAERSITSKREEYFAAGTQVVWDVDLFRGRCIRSYRVDAPTEPAIFKAGDEAHAEPALPGWHMSVDQMLNEAFIKQ